MNPMRAIFWRASWGIWSALAFPFNILIKSPCSRPSCPILNNRFVGADSPQPQQHLVGVSASATTTSSTAGLGVAFSTMSVGLASMFSAGSTFVVFGFLLLASLLRSLTSLVFVVFLALISLR